MSPIHRRRLAPSKRRGVIAALVAVLALGTAAAGIALAVHDEGFQLDGNTLASDFKTGFPTPTSELQGVFRGDYDWDSLFTAAGAKRSPLPPGFNDATFRKDYATKTKGANTVFDTSDPNTFTTGSKDILNINQWRCVGANNVTDKGDIMNAYTSVFVNGDGDRILYFGLEKHIDNGSNNVGFWFLGDNNAACQDGGTGNGNAFTGAHTDGDLLIVSEFSNGGGVSTIKAFEWVGSNPGALNQTPVEVGVDCVRGSDSSQNLDMCATTNILTHKPIWDHASKTLGLNNGYPPATFFEGAINLSNTVFADSCFNRFLADTRSSPSVTADLYDYTSGSIGACGSIKIIKVTGPDATDPTNFDFTSTEPAGKTNVPNDFMLDTDPADPSSGADALPSERTFTSIPAGSYSFTETAEPGWYLDKIECTKNGTPFSGDVATGTASFTVSGDNVVCTFTNYKPSAFLDIAGDGVNEVGTGHEFTVTAYKNDGSGGANQPAANVEVTVDFAEANGATAVADQTCTTNANGTCTVSFDSSATGTHTGTASASITVKGVSIPVTSSANSTSAGAADAVKKWVDAAIDIAGDGVNEVGTGHVFTVTTYAEGSGASATMAKVGGVPVTVTFAAANGAGSVADKECTTSSVNDSTFGTCTVSFNSNATGTHTGTASATITVEGEPIGVTTSADSTTPAAADAVKAWVKAAIDIVGDGVNRVGEDHVFTVKTYAEGSGTGADMALVGGVEVTVDFTEAGGTDPIDNKTCTTSTVADATFGTCTVSFTSSKTGSHTATASATITVETEPIEVTTTADATTAAARDVVKQWVDAALDIAGDGTNRVGDDHEFTVTAWADDSGSGAFEKVGGVEVTVSFAHSNGAGVIADKTCTTEDDDQDADFGTCSVTFGSDLTGKHTGTASASITVDGLEVEVTTTADSTTAAAADAVKTWVDARLSVTGDGTNGIGEAHTFTAHLEKDLGDGAGFVDAGGEQVTVTLVDGAGAVSVVNAAQTTCDVGAANGTGTNGDGECVVVFTSATAGTVTGSASATLTVDTVEITVASGDSTADDADDSVLKTFVDGSVRWYKEDHNGDPLGGATFEVCRTANLNTGTGQMAPIDPSICVTVKDNEAPDNDPDPGELELIDLILGQYTVEETIPPTGYVIGDDPGAGPFDFPAMTLADPDVELTEPFVNVKLFRLIVITCDDGTDSLVDGTVTLDGEPKETISADDLAALGWQDANGDPLTEQDFCNMGGASYGDLEEGTYNPSVELPDLSPLFSS